jgi:Protein of unknown function (DUF998)
VSTDVLLLAGVTAAIVFAAVLLVESARRPGYDPLYHTGSELELGEWGWVQRANFLFMGLGVFAYAVGVNRTLNTDVGAVLLAIFGFVMIVAASSFPTRYEATHLEPPPIHRPSRPGKPWSTALSADRSPSLHSSGHA